MDAYDLQCKLEPTLFEGDIDSCISQVIDEINKLSFSPFHVITDIDFNNPLTSVAKYFEDFIINENSNVSLKAIYAETNGFDINPDEWFFSLYGYDEFESRDGFDTGNDISMSKSFFTLTGLEELQKVYASDAFSEPKYELAKELCSLLIVFKFQKLIRDSAKLLKVSPITILATGHDYDYFWYQFRVIA